MFDAGQTRGEITQGNFSMVSGAECQKHLNWSLESVSGKILRIPRKCLANTLLLLIKLFKTISQMRYMQFLQDEEEVLIMSTTAALSHLITMRVF